MLVTAILRDSGVANGRWPAAPALSTLRNEPTALNQLFLFRFAKRKGYARDVPETRIKSVRPNAGPDIPDAEWSKLCAYLEPY